MKLFFSSARKYYMLPVIASLLLLDGCINMKDEALYVWSEPEGEERAHYVMFRDVFEVQDDATAMLQLFVDSRYHLYVNDSFVHFGPARFYPENPQYDSYDLTDLLVDGENVIAIKALSNGTNTYQVPLSKAGFIAWGKVKEGKRTIHDFTTPGSWVCKDMEGFDRKAPKMSFATGPMEIYDGRKDPAGWRLQGFDDSEWGTPVTVADQDHWGSFSKRTIPFLTADRQPASEMLGAYKLMQDEDLYSFRVKSPDRTRREFGTNKYAFSYTYIYSPRPQKVRAGLFWGEFWLNGRGPLSGLGVEPGKPVRSDVMLELEEGWNYFFMKYGIVWGSWEFYMALPTSADLVLSPLKDTGSPEKFMTAGPFTDVEEEEVRALSLPFSSPDELPELSAGWEPKTMEDGAGNPAWEVAWSYFDRSFSPEYIGETITLPANEPVALVYDLGAKTLGRFYIDVEAPPGTIVDIAFAEDLQNNRPWILKRPGLYTALRFITRKNNNYFESFKPYGARYIQVNISGHQAPVKMNDVGMISQVYPFEKAGSFECSDTMLNAIWELGWRTLIVCSEDSYTDTPFRERGLYAGDALPEYAISLVGSGDSRLMQHCTFLFSQMYSDLMDSGSERKHASVNHMADYPLLTLLAWAWTINRTGDMEYAEEYYDGYRNLMENTAGWRRADGLLEHPRAFVEWTRIDKNATLTAVQSLAAYCFRTMAGISEMLEKDDAEWFLEEERKTLEAMQRLCWDENKGAFIDGFRKEQPIDHHYPISSIWPTLFGQTTPEQEARLSGFYGKTLEDIGDVDRQRLATPYGGFYIIDALYRQGYTETAQRFMKKYWSPMILKHNDTAWENFGDGSDGGGQGTLSHAWSGGPTYHMTRHILGVDMGFPEFNHPDTLVFRPNTVDLSWAKGRVPHPRGIIDVSWKISGDRLFFNCEVPEGVIWSVEPAGSLANLELLVNDVTSSNE